ncbi:hypothetical protein RFI_20243 [Reticulomyxa filosa]|uniref:Uncharacterized protein n=1 Tax=Reticulomyxa filosa TaxID=46433 RepID=X6MTU3_RETFI|nr:hypothetical protein RFI_20243 [Reticulomyxa filosa]|eukprot:ETO17091.1 hypothetical protein RFI_20243 [Reticulomyxa filosa]
MAKLGEIKFIELLQMRKSDLFVVVQLTHGLMMEKSMICRGEIGIGFDDWWINDYDGINISKFNKKKKAILMFVPNSRYFARRRSVAKMIVKNVKEDPVSKELNQRKKRKCFRSPDIQEMEKHLAKNNSSHKNQIEKTNSKKSCNIWKQSDDEISLDNIKKAINDKERKCDEEVEVDDSATSANTIIKNPIQDWRPREVLSRGKAGLHWKNQVSSNTLIILLLPRTKLLGLNWMSSARTLTMAAPTARSYLDAVSLQDETKSKNPIENYNKYRYFHVFLSFFIVRYLFEVKRYISNESDLVRISTDDSDDEREESKYDQCRPTLEKKMS